MVDFPSSCHSLNLHQTINWSGGDPLWKIRLLLVEEETDTIIEVLAQDLPNSGHYSLPCSTAGVFRIRVEAIDNGELRDFSFSDFFGVGQSDFFCFWKNMS